MSRRTLFLVLMFVAVSIMLSNAAFVPSSNGASRLGFSRLMVIPRDPILEAYQKKIGVKTAASKAASIQAPTESLSAPTESLPVPTESLSVPTESLPVPSVPTESAVPPVVVESPPMEALQAPPLPEQVEQVTTSSSTGSDPISSMLNTITSPFRDVDPFEKIKIPADLKNVDLNKELKNVDLKQTIQSMSAPDFKMPDFKSIRVPDFRNVDFANIQLPTPPERPEAPGVILPSGARMQTLLDVIGKPDVGQWEMPTSLSLPGIVEALRFSEFGAWYLAGFLLVAWQIQIQNTEELYQEKLSEAEKKARQAAEAASVAAEGATLTKKLASEKKATKPFKSTETILSESQREALRLEKEQMKKQLEILQQETEALKRQLQAAKSADETVVNGATDVTPPKVQPKTVEPVDAETNAQLLEIIKQQDEANAAKAKAAPKKKKAAVPKKKSEKKTTPKKEPVTARKEADVAVMEPIVKVEEEMEAEPTKSDEVFFANVTEAEEKPKKIAAKKDTTKETEEAKKEVEAAPTTSDNPWKELSLSTLKRKTVKEISAYLIERDVQVTDEAGKPLKKAELLDKVMAL
mmetsp:Transcript_1080/g.2019  ORF Transcript_1080/g.2019 Transcript_1080/m.2019 type:complete len:579 (-) Transcript_1080:95-1831(-)|eukprot:CAMPEP_0202484228 /NCGR_PEP_ID=MMETSP1361-20130828/3337_1 /ASSEMBLY_ACC=CAM_ASM_000849 /TAXON_ID=210615 /ORGANISM="Staurosira complex sp., Strain CCMP2646" /LENGTH=578 /DNA_ID=CAMNT_0049112799 /DNA_START=14 /DNA_END=1750 /DNA_ORIENTATION=-